mmetsp:Transcript_23010/g.58347  ORF Transcript_23010/g.58347 Transcript_23010/m.58347 type:complete len:144 (+) Transcript_23010:22-453(+)
MCAVRVTYLVSPFSLLQRLVWRHREEGGDRNVCDLSPSTARMHTYEEEKKNLRFVPLAHPKNHALLTAFCVCVPAPDFGKACITIPLLAYKYKDKVHACQQFKYSGAALMYYLLPSGCLHTETDENKHQANTKVRQRHCSTSI